MKTNTTTIYKKMNTTTAIYKTMRMQREIKKRLLYDGGGIYIIQPQWINENDFLFLIKDTLISFFITNWDDFFEHEHCLDFKKEYTVKFELVSIAPSAIKQNVDSPFLGDAIVLEVFESSNKNKLI